MFIELNEGGAWDYWLPAATWADYHVYHFTILLPQARSRHPCTNSFTWQKSSVRQLLWLEVQLQIHLLSHLQGQVFFPPDSHYCSVSLGLSLLPFLLYGTCPGQLQSCLTKLSIRKHFPKPFLSSPSENMSPVPHQLGHTSHLFIYSHFAFGNVSVLRWTQFRSAPSAEKPQLFHKIFVPDFTFSPVNIASRSILNFSCQTVDFLLRRGFIQYFPFLLSTVYLHCLILRKYFPPRWPEEALFFYVNVIFWRTSLS